MKTFLLFCFAAAVFSGCVRSDSPFYEEGDIVTNTTFNIPAAETPAEQVEIKPWVGNPGYYGVTYIKWPCTMSFRGVLFQIGTNRFFDLYATPEACDHVGGTVSPIEMMQSVSLQPLHMVVKVPPTTNGVFAIVDQKGLNAALRKAPEFFQSARPGEIPKMVSDTRKLRDFLAQFGGDKEVFSHEITRSEISPTNRMETTKPTPPALKQTQQPRPQFE